MTLTDELPDNPFATLVEADSAPPPDSLFDERNTLARIRDYARQRLVSPEAVLIKILMRANVGAPAHVLIPPMIGTAKPRNMAVVGVGPSGMGKTSSDDVAEDYWPLPLVPTWPLGTAEGACQAFDPDDDGQPQEPNIIFSSSEIDNWAALGERAGSMTFPVLRQIVTGDQIGQKNASKAHTRIVNKRSYSAGLSLSAQPASKGSAMLFADAPGGFPQRCLFGSEIDPEAPDDPPQGVQPYRPPEPDFTPNVGDHYEIPFPESVVDEIRAHRRRVLRGDPTIDPLDGHRNLTKAKVAAGLMLIDGRNEVTEDDWRIAERIMEMSDRTRASLAAAARQALTEANRARGHAIADRDEVVADRKMQRAKQTIIRWLGKAVELPSADLRRRLKADIRDYYGAAIAELADEGAIREIDIKNGSAYRLAAEGTRVPEVHPKNPQVSRGVPLGTRVPPGSVTELDSRRSHDTTPPKLSAPQWLENHIAELRAIGSTTVESFAVYAAGEAAGYRVDNLRTAASRNKMVTVVDRANGGATWDITGATEPTYGTAGQFVSKYLDALPATATIIDRDHFRSAAEAAGFTWTAARHAALGHRRIRSVPAEGDSTVKRAWELSPPAARLREAE